ncbi:MAG: HAD-IIIA family hydrolase [Anaerolineae bacterium]|nr:HAD-IIIA family hydrolase [Anaerolineae bacterium]
MRKYALIIFDADGTLRRSTIPGQPCPNRPGEWELLPNVREVLSTMAWGDPAAGKTAFGIASNQAGVGYGFLSEVMALRLLEDMVRAAFGCEPPPGAIQLCPHKVDAGCLCRKPGTLMLERLLARWHLTPQEVLFVGDMKSDQEAAARLGCDFVWATEFQSRKEFFDNKRSPVRSPG